MSKHESIIFANENQQTPENARTAAAAPAASTTKKSAGGVGSSSMSLEQCLREHTKEEILDCANSVYCSKCKKHQQAKKMVKFWSPSLPKVLIIVLKRFEFRDVSSIVGRKGMALREKIDSMIDFPLEGLDIAPYCGDPDATYKQCVPLDGDCKEGRREAEELLAAYCSPSSKKPLQKPDMDIVSPSSLENATSDINPATLATPAKKALSAQLPSTKYDLFACCNHYGRLGFGHYTAHARDWTPDILQNPTPTVPVGLGSLSDQWYEFDDEDVRAVPGDPHSHVVTNNAYILFYKKRE